MSNPAFTSGDRLRTFDVVLANPPYSIKSWDRAAWQSDKWGRNLFGTPPQGRADYAFWQHILASMDPKTGRCAILFPHGVLFRNEEQDMRTKMIESDVIEAVLGLGPNLFYNSPMEACVVFCRSVKPKERKNKVLFINAVDQVTRQQAQSFLTVEHIAKIAGAYESFTEEAGFTAIATKDQILANGGDLNIVKYVKRDRDETEVRSLSEVLADWRTSSTQLREAAAELFEVLEAGA